MASASPAIEKTDTKVNSALRRVTSHVYLDSTYDCAIVCAVFAELSSAELLATERIVRKALCGETAANILSRTRAQTGVMLKLSVTTEMSWYTSNWIISRRAIKSLVHAHI